MVHDATEVVMIILHLVVEMGEGFQPDRLRATVEEARGRREMGEASK